MSEATATARPLPSSSPAEDTFDLMSVLVPVWKGKWVILLVTALSVGAAMYYSFQKEPAYRAYAVMAPVEAGGGQSAGIPASLGGLASLAGLGNAASQNSSLTSSLAIARSKTFAMEFIDRHDLMPMLIESTRDYQGHVDSLSKLDAAIVLQSHVNVAVVNGLVQLQIRWSDPNSAADLANRMCDFLNVYLRTKAISEADSSIDYLKGEILRTPVASMQEMLNRLIEKQIELKTMAKVRTQYAFNIIDFAVPPMDMDSPNRKKDAAKGVALGLGLSLALIFGRIMFRNVRRNFAQAMK